MDEKRKGWIWIVIAIIGIIAISSSIKETATKTASNISIAQSDNKSANSTPTSQPQKDTSLRSV